MIQTDVERIVRDVVTARGVGSVLHARLISGGWIVSVKDQADRIITFTVPDGPPAAVRAAAQTWAEHA
jgi:hypothetical protein